MAGIGWSCTVLPKCTRTDSLAPGVSYPPIMVGANVASNAPAQLANQVTVSGGGSASASAVDGTHVLAQSARLNVSLSHNGNFTQGENGAVYQISVSNTVYSALSASPAAVSLGAATCSTQQQVVIASNGNPIAFRYLVQYPNGIDPAAGDANGAWLTATIAGNTTADGTAYASSTGPNGVVLTLRAQNQLTSASAQAWVVLVPADPTMKNVVVPVTYTPFVGSCTLYDFVWATPSSISFTAPLGSTQTQTLSLQNPSSDPTPFSVSVSGGSWLSATTDFTAVPGNNFPVDFALVRVTIDTTHVSSVGSMSGVVTISGNGSSFAIPVTALATPGPTADYPVVPAVFSGIEQMAH